MVQSEFYEAMRILFVCKENKNNDIYSTIRLLSNTWIHCFHSNQSVNKRTICIHVLLMTENSVRTLRPSDALQNGATLTQRGREETVNGKFSVIPPASGVSKRAKNLLNSSGVKGCP